MLTSIIPVPPLCIRPTVLMNGGKTNEDDLTIKLLEIQKQIKQIEIRLNDAKDWN